MTQLRAMTSRVKGHALRAIVTLNLHGRPSATAFKCQCGQRAPKESDVRVGAILWHRQHKVSVLSTQRKETAP